MGTKRKKKHPEKDESQHYTFSDEATRNKIKRHIRDIKDIITDEDIAKAKIPGEETPPVKSEKQIEQKKKNTHPGTSGEGNPITPWDIFD